jgi:hypothetical protein
MTLILEKSFTFYFLTNIYIDCHIFAFVSKALEAWAALNSRTPTPLNPSFFSLQSGHPLKTRSYGYLTAPWGDLIY